MRSGDVMSGHERSLEVTGGQVRSGTLIMGGTLNLGGPLNIRGPLDIRGTTYL